jgi:hypothetical protein
MNDHDPASARHGRMTQRPYAMFALNLLLSLVVMYGVMFSMIDGRGDFRNNLNTLYMALTMVAPMGALMLATMPGMYARKALNVALYAGLAAVFALAFVATRNQAGIGDRQFVASMIPHHSGAILMCREASLKDPDLVELCGQITRSQREEIERMQAVATRLPRVATAGAAAR